jgi:hypothetical protein
VGLTEEAKKDTAPAQGRGTRNRFECSPPNRKRPRTWIAESGQKMTDMTNRRDNVTFSGWHVEEDGVVRGEEDSKPSLVTRISVVRGEEDSKPSLVTRISAARIESCQDQEVLVPEEVAVGDIPLGWTRVKLEPDC